MNTSSTTPELNDVPRSVLDNLLEGCQVIGPDFRYLYVNDAVVRHGRSTRAELLGRTMEEAYPGIEHTAMFALLRRCMQDRSPRRMENVFTFPDGSRGWFDLRFEPVPQGVAILSVDVTERHEAQARIVRLNSVLRAIRDVNQLIVRESDPATLVEQACQLLVAARGYEVAAIYRVEDDRLRRAAWAGGEQETTALEGPAPDLVRIAVADARATVRPGAGAAGEPATRATVAVPLLGPDGGPALGALLVVLPPDISPDDEELSLLGEAAGDVAFALHSIRVAQQRDDALESLRRAQRLEAIGRLAGGVAHDFNNLLTVVTGHTGLVLASLPDGDPLQRTLRVIEDATHRATALTRQLLAFGRSQAMEAEVVAPGEVFRDLEHLLQRLVGEDVTLEFDVADDLGRILADRGQLEQILLNLAINARDAMREGGTLTVAAANRDVTQPQRPGSCPLDPGPYVVVVVTDTGCGMDAATRDRIFEPFFTTKGPNEGTGLGLSTVYGIVTQWGGQIDVRSAVGQGTAFTISLPRVEAEPTVLAPAAAPVKRAHGGETILVVEDEDELRELATEILSAAGYRVLAATDGAAALREAGEHPGRIDLLLSDIMLPLLSGPEVAEQLVESRPGIKVLFTSGYVPDALARRSQATAGVDLLDKPYSPSELTAKVRALLDRG